MAKTKPQSRVPGVYCRDDGVPRWEAKVRWIKNGKRNLCPLCDILST